MTVDSESIAAVSDLCVDLVDGVPVVLGVTFDLEPGRVLALVGESGCGKTTVALALLGHARRGLALTSGSVVVKNQPILGQPSSVLRDLRGRVVSCVPQDPTEALNPTHRIGRQIVEALAVHGRSDGARAVAGELCERVGLPSGNEFLNRYPFQLSGGQQQRVAIAIALACQPDIVVLDEPTTGLDVTTQRRVLDLLMRLKDQSQMAMVYVSHDLAIVQEIADDVAVLYAGRILEKASREQLFSNPAHPYTALLLASVPRLSGGHRLEGIAGTAPSPGNWPTGCAFAPRCPKAGKECSREAPVQVLDETHTVSCWHPYSVRPSADKGRITRPTTLQPEPLLTVSSLGASYTSRKASAFSLHDVSFSMAQGECLAIVGESGSGKSTLGRCIAGLHTPDRGTIVLKRKKLAPSVTLRSKEDCRKVQLIYQNPDRSLNPRESVINSVMRAIHALTKENRREVRNRAEMTLERVRLPRNKYDRYPRELSGGEKQRVAIARAIAVHPDLLICDEVTSALDVSIQAAIISLLAELRMDGLSLVFITHNLPLVPALADSTIVLQRGTIVEHGPTHAIVHRPSQSYTQELMAAAPDVETPW